MAPVPNCKIAGLFTNGNVNSTVPPGALTQANNVVMRASGCLEPRRGMQTETNHIGSNSTLNALAFYGSGRIAEYTESGNEKLAYSTTGGGAWTAYSGTYSPVSSSLLRMKFVEANQNLYFNTTSGLKVLTSLSGTPAGVGFVAPLDPWYDYVGLDKTPDAAGTWLPVNSAVAYRILFGIKDTNNNLKLGSPGGRIVVTNPANVTVANGSLARNGGNVVTATVASHQFYPGAYIQLTNPSGAFLNTNAPFVVSTTTPTTFTYSDNVGGIATSGTDYTFTTGAHSVTLGSIYFDATDLTTSHFVRVYRSLATSSATTDPGDELYQIYERKLTATEVSNGYFSFSDTTPESSLYSTPLYTNPKTGEGISSANDRPPVSKDIALWQERIWFANTTDRHRYMLQLLGTGAPDGIQNGDYLAINDRVYKFVTFGTPAEIEIGTYYSTLPAKTLEITARNLTYNTGYDLVANAQTFFATYVSGFGDPPGKVLFQRKNLTDGTMYFGASRPGSFNPVPATLFAVTEASSSRTSNTNIHVTTSSTHDFLVGDQVYLASRVTDANFPVGLKTVTAKTGTTFDYTEAGTGTPVMTGEYYAYKATITSDNNARPNGIMYSKPQEPEAVPLANYFAVGAKNKQILRIVPLRDKLFVFKEDGLYTVSGTPPYQSVDLLDATCILLAPDSAVVAGGKIYAFTRQGVVEVSESGVGVISYPIEDLLRQYQIYTSAQLATAYGTAYESDRLYIYAPDTATQYVYNFMTKAWTTWSLSARHMGVDPASDSLTALYSFSNVALVERKTQLLPGYSTDYFDTTSSINITAVNAASTAFDLDAFVASGTLIRAANGAFCIATSGGITGVSFAYETDLGPPNTGAATYWVSPQYTVTFARNTLSQPGVTKHWKWIELHFGLSNMYRISGNFSDCEGRTGSSTSDLPSILEIGTASYARNTRILVPLECQRSTSLQPGFTAAQGKGYFRLDGVTFDVDMISTRIQK